jgi:hypothetical protein
MGKKMSQPSERFARPPQNAKMQDLPPKGKMRDWENGDCAFFHEVKMGAVPIFP